MALRGNTAENAIVVHDSEGEAEHPPKADTRNDAAIALLYFQEINPNRNARGLGRYYDGPAEENRGRLTLGSAGGKATKRTRTQPSRTEPYPAPRDRGTEASSTVTHAVSGATLDTSGRPASAPPGFSALPASQAGPAVPRSASAPAGLPDLGNVARYLGDDTPALEQSFRAITLLDKMTEPSLFARVKSPVPGYLPVVEDLPDDQLIEPRPRWH